MNGALRRTVSRDGTGRGKLNVSSNLIAWKLRTKARARASMPGASAVTVFNSDVSWAPMTTTYRYLSVYMV